LLFAAIYGGVDVVDPVSGFLLGRINTPDDIIFNVEPAKGKGAWLLTGRDYIYKASGIAEEGA
jgi:gluconolactonase